MSDKKILGIVLIIVSLGSLLFLFAAFKIANFVTSNVMDQTENGNVNVEVVINGNLIPTNADSPEFKEVSSRIRGIVSNALLFLSIPCVILFLIGVYLVLKKKDSLPEIPKNGIK